MRKFRQFTIGGICLVTLVFSQNAFAAAAFVNNGYGGTGGVQASFPVVIPATGKDHLIVVMVLLTGNAVQSVTDDKGNNYTTASAVASAPGVSCATEIWYLPRSTSGTTQITVTFTTSTTGGAWVAEFSGLNTSNPLSAVNVKNSAAASLTPTAPTVTPASSNSVVASIGCFGNNVTGIHAGNPFTALPIQNGDDAAYYIPTTSAAYGASWDQASSLSYCASTAAFRVPISHSIKSF